VKFEECRYFSAGWLGQALMVETQLLENLKQYAEFPCGNERSFFL
jgi:hypothetical protein